MAFNDYNISPDLGHLPSSATLSTHPLHHHEFLTPRDLEPDCYASPSRRYGTCLPFPHGNTILLHESNRRSRSCNSERT